MAQNNLTDRARKIAEKLLKQARGDKKVAYQLFVEEVPMTMRQELEDLWFERGVYKLFAEVNGQGHATGHRAESVQSKTTRVQPDDEEFNLPVPVQQINIPRISVEALTRANQRLQESILDTIQINGRPIGDYRVFEVAEWCRTRHQATGIILAVIKDLPGQQVLRHAISPADAETRRLNAVRPMLDGGIIDARQPNGYRVL